MLASAPVTPAHHPPLPQRTDLFSVSYNSHRSSSALPSVQADNTSSKLQTYQHHQPKPFAQPSVILNTTDVPIDHIDFFMPHSYDFPSTQAGLHTYAQDSLPTWSLGGGNPATMVNNMAATGPQMIGHQRHPSTSSVGSAASAASSQYQSQQISRGMRGSGDYSGKQGKANYGKQWQQSRSHLPTPSQTPTRNSFASSRPSSFAQQGSNMDSAMQAAMEAAMLMNPSMLNQHQAEDDVNQAQHTQRQPLSAQTSAVHRRSSATPQLVHQDSMSAALLPKFTRTVTDAYQDNLYFAQPAAASQHASNSSYLMPGNSMVNDRLLEAQMARSQSSGSNHSLPMSPFRAYAQVEGQQYHTSPQASVEPKTISPKEALLDYNPSHEYPLFPQSNAALNNAYVTAQQSTRSDLFNGSNDLNYSNQGWNANMRAFTSGPVQALNSFATPALPATTVGMGNLAYANGHSSHGSRSVQRQTERTPEFTPAQLTRMESSASEAPQSSQASSAQNVVSPKPESAADSGTYSCTFHGCTQRFTTPQKLQKHKRDSHRNSITDITPGVGSGMTTAQLMERNSQSGPHVCGRPNPTTGKPCDAVFSRPYDLTRHEDTIHNIRKQKVRCAICTEEKTFSRSDALTRHMRVVHPEVDFPGKHRKRGSRDEA